MSIDFWIDIGMEGIAFESVPPAVAGGDFGAAEEKTPPTTVGGTDRDHFRDVFAKDQGDGE